MRRLVFTVNHEPFGKARAMRGPHGSFKDAKTTTAELAVRNGWLALEEQPWVKGEPVEIRVMCRMTRPQGHFRTNGLALSKSGEAMPFPCKKPDVDNISKTVMDALNRYAYFDDAQVVTLTIEKVWTTGAGTMVVTIQDRPGGPDD